ncbi:hypothetical protein RI543_001750 [Arxiozyma heterogenica]|uniref:Histone chaperone RTT106 n=1 Tax=Arxiozyma heterogenica TaxID=278026 RepID=A0AAN7WTE8_9SACH|nr:hypothetical protein RI543_001750 [Kazachstania heterogenica]
MSFLDDLPVDLQKKIKKVTSILPNTLDTFKELYEFAINQNNQSTNDSKRRKLNNSSYNTSNNNDESSRNSPAGYPDNLTVQNMISQDDIIFQLKDVSVLSPLRKKLNFFLHLSSIDKAPILSLERDSKIELSIHDLRSNIQMAVFLPVSEKPNLTYLFIKYAHSNSYNEPILINLANDLILNQFHKLGILETSVTDFASCIDYIRKQAILTGFRISNPFSSNGDPMHSSFSINCHRGTKEGTLYFLPDNILFGFKKPILLFDSNDIESITYSSITRLTFNMTLITKKGQTFEFSMIDQNEYTRIDEYVKRKQVVDRSMSEELKAKTKSKISNNNNNMGSHNNNSINNSKNNEDSLDPNNTNGHQSILEAASKQFEQSNKFNLNDVHLDSEDDEALDANFEAESDLSDGSEIEEVEEFDKEEEEEENDLEEVSHSIINNQQHSINMDLSTSLKDIPIEIDDDDDDDDDIEGSGVEYD